MAQPTTGSEKSEALDTNLKGRWSPMQAATSAIDWWFTTSTEAPRGIRSRPSTRTLQSGFTCR